MNFIQRGFIIRNGDLLPLKNSDDLCFALPGGGFMVDGLKLLVTDGRIILVILQEKACLSKRNEEHAALIGNQEILLSRTLIMIQR